MRFRSTGLGNTELYANLVNVEIKEDLLILYFDTYKPVEWHLRAGIQAQDRVDMIKLIFGLHVKLIPYLFRWHSRKPPREPESI